jgi:hypothetical protein
MTYLPKYIQFNYVSGSFNIFNMKLLSLRGCPQEIGGYFSCGQNLITSFIGGPKKILTSPQYINNGYGYAASRNKKLISIEGLPKTINGQLWMTDSGKNFTEEEIRKICNVKGQIFF